MQHETVKAWGKMIARWALATAAVAIATWFRLDDKMSTADWLWTVGLAGTILGLGEAIPRVVMRATENKKEPPT